MSWLVLLKKLIPHLGPLGAWLKETIIGLINHPGMEGRPKRIRVSLIVIVVLATLLYYSTTTAIDLYEENKELEFQLRLKPDRFIESEERIARFTEETQLNFDLMICEQRLDIARRDSGSAEQQLYEERRMRRDAERKFLEYQELYLQCPTQTERTERKEVPVRTDNINRRLDRLRQGSG